MVIRPEAIVPRPVAERDNWDEMMREYYAGEHLWAVDDEFYPGMWAFHALDDFMDESVSDMMWAHTHPGHWCKNVEDFVEVEPCDCPFCDGDGEMDLIDVALRNR